jgi:hypothetical protein
MKDGGLDKDTQNRGSEKERSENKSRVADLSAATAVLREGDQTTSIT